MSSVVLITGGSTGFGRAAVETLARGGFTVFATMRDVAGRNSSHCEALKSLTARENLALEVLEMDVTRDASVDSCVKQVLTKAGRIDVVVNNAGFASIGITEAYTAEQFQQVFDTNVCGAIRVNRAVLPTLRSQRSGLLVHVSSAAGRAAVPCMAPYCASKFALEALADTYRFELAPFGVDSVLIEPGIYKTAIFDKILEPADAERVAAYGGASDSAVRVRETFRRATSAAGAPESEEFVEALTRLIETPPGNRPFRTLVGASLDELLGAYNEMASALRPIVAQIFDVPELAQIALAASASAND